MEQQIQLNDHNKQEYPPMHTAEHLLNATMVKTFGCPRSRNAHIERKKSNCVKISALEILTPAPVSDCMYQILLKWELSKSLAMTMTKKGKH